ncbi:MAG: reverse transcriptase family protein, partial [Acholeplasmataceae bacterium]
RYFHIKKKRGGYRTILSPDTNLRKIQNFIKIHILEKLSIHHAAHGFVPKKSITTHATSHINSKIILNVDLRDYFPSISANRLYYLFGKICQYDNKITQDLVSICMYNNGLPQGACTSPIISNIVSYKLDMVLEKYCKKREIRYTRYADDLTFSGDINDIYQGFFTKVAYLIKQEGFEINDKKTRIGNTKKGTIVTGLNVINNKIQVPRNYIKRIETELYYISKHGIYDHKKHLQINNRNYLEHLKGKIMFVSHVENEIGNVLIEKYNQLIKEIPTINGSILDIIPQTINQ